jgi:hypothetical protein
MRISYREASNDSLVTPEMFDGSQQNSGNPTQMKVPRHVVQLKIDPKRKREEHTIDINMGLNAMNGESRSKGAGRLNGKD